MQSHLRSSIHLVSACEPRPSAASIAALNPRNAWSLDMTPSVRGCSARSARKPLTAWVKPPMLTRMSARCFASLRCSSRPFTSGWRRRAEIEVVLLLQLTDDGRQVDKLDLRRPHFRLDPVQLPCPTLRAAVWANPHGLSVTQTGQPLQFERAAAPRALTRSVVASLPCQNARFFAGGARLAAAFLAVRFFAAFWIATACLRRAASYQARSTWLMRVW